MVHVLKRKHLNSSVIPYTIEDSFASPANDFTVVIFEIESDKTPVVSESLAASAMLYFCFQTVTAYCTAINTKSQTVNTVPNNQCRAESTLIIMGNVTRNGRYA